MAKVYILIEKKTMPIDRSPESGKSYEDTIGVITNHLTAKRFEKAYKRGYLEFELDDPELLNRIAKTKLENEK